MDIKGLEMCSICMESCKEMFDTNGQCQCKSRCCVDCMQKLVSTEAQLYDHMHSYGFQHWLLSVGPLLEFPMHSEILDDKWSCLRRCLHDGVTSLRKKSTLFWMDLFRFARDRKTVKCPTCRAELRLPLSGSSSEQPVYACARPGCGRPFSPDTKGTGEYETPATRALWGWMKHLQFDCAVPLYCHFEGCDFQANTPEQLRDHFVSGCVYHGCGVEGCVEGYPMVTSNGVSSYHHQYDESGDDSDDDSDNESDDDEDDDEDDEEMEKGEGERGECNMSFDQNPRTYATSDIIVSNQVIDDYNLLILREGECDRYVDTEFVKLCIYQCVTEREKMAIRRNILHIMILQRKVAIDQLVSEIKWVLAVM